LLHIPCAAHTLQLALRKIGELQPYNAIFHEVTKILERFSSEKLLRLQLRNSQKNRKELPLKLIKPVMTRWSSKITAAQRLLQLEPHITRISIPVSEGFWKNLRTVVTFLEPFKIATNNVQRQNAKLIDVYREFGCLSDHLQAEVNAMSIMSETATACHNCLQKEFTTHLNPGALAAVAAFSFDKTGMELLKKTRVETATFIADWGKKFLTKFYPNDAENVGVQALQFTTKSGHFQNVEDEAASLTFKGGFDPIGFWGLFIDQPARAALARVALALLSVVPTEAAVERSFSAQADTHSRDRNSLSQELVESEMILKWNLPRLQALVSNLPYAPAVEEDMSDDDEC